MLRECYQISIVVLFLNKAVTKVKSKALKYLILCMLLWPLVTVAQLPSIFNSDFEKKQIHQSSPDFGKAGIQLFLAATLGDDPTAMHNAENEFGEIIHKLEQDYPVRSKETRQVDFIYRGLRKAMFKHYTYIAEVAETFESGTFNCVGSTALVALALDHFGFSYEIQRLPNHVFLYAKADEKWLRIETTSLDIGVIREKRISTAERNAVGRRKRSKVTPETINLQDLAGWQYYNEGLKAMDASTHELAFKSFYKASLLNANAEIEEMLDLANASLLKAAKEALAAEDYEYAINQLALANKVGRADNESVLCLAASILGKAESISDISASLNFLKKMQADFPKAMALPAVQAAIADRHLALALEGSTELDTANEQLMEFIKTVNSSQCPFDLSLAESSFSSVIENHKALGQMDAARTLAKQFGKLKLHRIQLDQGTQIFAGK